MYELPFMYLLGFGMGTMLAKFHVCGIMLFLRAVIVKHDLEKCKSKRDNAF